MARDLPTPEPDIASPIPQRVLVVHERLCRDYGCPVAFFHELDPLSELVSSLLSHRTKNHDSGRAFKALRERFPTWEAVRDAPVAEVEECLKPCTWPEQKAPRIQAVLREITRRNGGSLTLDSLANLPVAQARAWLEQISGIGPKTSAAVLLFSHLRKPALPVDSHHHRVAARLGFIPAMLPVGPSHAVLESLLPRDWDAQALYDHHEVMMFHGQRCCTFHKPDCERCSVLDLCPHGQTRLGRIASPPRTAAVTPRRPSPSESPTLPLLFPL